MGFNSGFKGLMTEKYRATGEETDFSIVKVSSNVKWFKSCNFSYYYIIK